MEQFHGTTIVSVRRGDKVALGGDGQVTLGNIVMKGGAKKVRRIYGGKVMVGFAGGTAGPAPQITYPTIAFSQLARYIFRITVRRRLARCRDFPLAG